MGRLFRSYWLPALLASELPENECPPVRVKLLSERLLAWRDTQGRYSLIDEFCAHRGTSLWVGRNEEDGLRCPYHGWKYDWTGQCIDVPSEPEESGFCQKIKLKSYPLVKRGDVLWAYMGPPETAAAAAGIRVRHRAAGAELHLQAAAGMQLAAGAWKAASIPATPHGCTAATWKQTPCTGARRAINTTSTTRGRTSKWSKAPAGFSSAHAATPTADNITGASRNGSCPASA